MVYIRNDKSRKGHKHESLAKGQFNSRQDCKERRSSEKENVWTYGIILCVALSFFHEFTKWKNCIILSLAIFLLRPLYYEWERIFIYFQCGRFWRRTSNSCRNMRNLSSGKITSVTDDWFWKNCIRTNMSPLPNGISWNFHSFDGYLKSISDMVKLYQEIHQKLQSLSIPFATLLWIASHLHTWYNMGTHWH